jgi:hypothetical protein
MIVARECGAVMAAGWVSNQDAMVMLTRCGRFIGELGFLSIE